MDREELKRLLERIDIETYLQDQGIDYKETFSAKGVQLNLKHCPLCGSSKWKVYINAETGLGNCLAGDTEILTREFGAIAIEKVSGMTVTLLDGNGDWVPCLIKDHGLQTTYAAKFASFYGSHIIRSTAEHGWVSPEGDIVLTKDLRRRSNGASQVADLRYTRKIVNQTEYEKGVIHGLVYGDGSKEQHGNYRIRICSHHDSINPYLGRFHYSVISGRGREDRRFYIPKREAWCELKELPDAAHCEIDYLIGFFRGWLATDGCVAETGTASICAGIEEAAWIRQWAPVIGWLPRAHSLLPEVTNFGKRNKVVGNQFIAAMSFIADDFLVEQHKTRWSNRNDDWAYGKHKWSFKSTKEGKNKPYDPRVERVYCPVVPTTHSFALANGIHSRNCFDGDHPPGKNYNKWTFIKAHIGTNNYVELVRHIRDTARQMGLIARQRVKKRVNLDVGELKLPESLELPVDGKNAAYLSKRNISHKTTADFNLRLCVKGKHVIKQGDEEKVQYFNNRVIIPVFDMDGNLVTYQGRDVTGESKFRYLFPIGFAVTARYLYNAHNVIGMRTVVVNEGVFDVMATHQAFQDDPVTQEVGVVGTFGKHLSHDVEGKSGMQDQFGEFLKLRDQGLRHVVMMWDSETRAIKDALIAAKKLQSIGLIVRIAILPDGKDPAECTPEEVRAAFYRAVKVTPRNELILKMGRVPKF